MKLPTHWTTKDKRSIPIAGMSDGHLVNSIRFFRDRAEVMQWQDIESCMGAACSLNGDAAIYHSEQAMDEMTEEPTEDWLERQPLWRALTRETKRRKLTF